MSTKLSVANPYLRNRAARESMVIKSVITSSAIEGIRAVFKRSAQTDGKTSIRKHYLNRKKAWPLTSASAQ